MITPLAITAYILLSSFVLSRLNKSNILSTAPISVFFAMLWMTIFGILGDLKYGSISLIGFTLFTFLMLFVNPWERVKIREIKEFINLQIVVLVALIYWTYFHSTGIKFYEWDEFAHWGASVKSMFIFNQLGPESPIALNNSNYLPGLSVVSYLVMQLEGVWDESKVFWTYQIVLISILFGAISKFKSKQIWQTFLSLVLLILTALVFYNPFKTVYADPLLSITFGYSLWLAVDKKTLKNKISVIYFSLCIVSLYLIKEIGLVLGAISTLVLVINQLFVYKELRLKPKIIAIRIFIFGIGTAILTFGLRWLWTLYQCISSGGGQTCGSKSVNTISNVIPTSSEPSSVSSSAYIEYLKTRTLTPWNGLDLSFTSWIWIFVFLLILWILSESRDRLRKILLSSAVVLGSVIYLYAIFVAYKNFGGTGSSFPSFERYVKTYLAGIAFFLAIASIRQFSIDSSNDLAKSNLAIPKLMAAMMLGVTFSSPQGFLIEFIESPTQFADPMREQFENIDKKIELSQFKLEDKIYIITQHKMGYEFYYLQYASIPGNAPLVPFSIGSKYGPGDYWTVEDITVNVWDEQLDYFDYVIVSNVSESFREEFGSIFKEPNLIEEQTIYFVEHSEQGNKLVKFI